MKTDFLGWVFFFKFDLRLAKKKLTQQGFSRETPVAHSRKFNIIYTQTQKNTRTQECSFNNAILRNSLYNLVLSSLYVQNEYLFFLENTKLHTLLCYEKLFTHQLGYALKSRKQVIKIGTELQSIYANISEYMINYMPYDFSYVNKKSQRFGFSCARRVSWYWLVVFIVCNLLLWPYV